MPDLHTRLLADVIALGAPYPLVLTGGYAVRARVNRPSQDLDVATENPAPEASRRQVRLHGADEHGPDREGPLEVDHALEGPLERLPDRL
jgi:hypothetical protein